MPIRPDITVYSKRGEPRLVVEVKSKPDASEEWAREYRRNLLSLEAFPPAPYFLLVTPDCLYLWKDPVGDPDALPAVRSKTRETLEPLLAAFPVDRMDQHALESITQAWLDVLVGSPDLREDIRDRDGWLIETGLFDSIVGGHVELEPAA